MAGTEEVEVKNSEGKILCKLTKDTVYAMMKSLGIKSKKKRIIKKTIRRFIEKELWKYLKHQSI
jgi:hypothetical protein